MIAMSLQNTWRASKIFSGPKHNFCLYGEDTWRGRNLWKPDLKNLQCSMFGIQKSLSPSFAPSLDLISVSLYFRSRRKWPGRKQMCIARSITCDGKVFQRDFSGLPRALRRAVFQGARRKSQRQMWKSFHWLTLHLHSTLTGRRAIAHLPARPWCGHLNHAANLAATACSIWHEQRLRLEMTFFVVVWGCESLSSCCWWVKHYISFHLFLVPLMRNNKACVYVCVCSMIMKA